MQKYLLVFSLFIFSGAFSQEHSIKESVSSDSLANLTFFYDPYYCYNGNYSDTDIFYVTGNFCGWAQPGNNESVAMEYDWSSGNFTATVTVTPYTEIQYKYFLGYGWENGEWLGEPNRIVHITAIDTVVWDFCENPNSPVYYPVRFIFDARNAPETWLNKTTDSLYLIGDFTGWGIPGESGYLNLSDPDGDGLYLGITQIMENTYNSYQYYSKEGTQNPEFPQGIYRKISISDHGTTVYDIYGFSDINQKREKITCGPNPFHNFIQIPNFEQVNIFEIYSVNAGLMLKKTNLNSQQINTSSLQNGSYLIRIVYKNGHSEQLLLVKE
jgi:hypothetical protein